MLRQSLMDNIEVRSLTERNHISHLPSYFIHLTDQPDYDHAKNYWKVLKFRLVKEGNESVTNCNQLKLVSPKDGKKY